MSLGTRARAARSSGKAAPVKKKVRKQKSEVRGSRKRFASSKEVDIEEVRKRVLDGLEHLGHQKLSTEPGGYNLSGWLRSLDTLLDDFEEKASDSLTEEYHETRKAVVERFSKPVETTKLDDELEAARKEEAEIRAKMLEESERISARLNDIGADKIARSKDLEEEKVKLKNVQDERKNASFFSKLMGRGPSTEPYEKKVADLEKNLKMLEDEALNLQTVRKSLEGRSGEKGLHDGLWTRLEELGTKLKELEDARQVRDQLAEEREEAAASLRKTIAEIKFEEKKE